MACVSYCQRDTANPIPCRLQGGCGYDHEGKCPICRKPVNQPGPHIHNECHTRIDQALDRILHLTAEAHAQTQPVATTNTGRTTPGSKPPLAIDALDPELTLVRLVKSDESSDTPILEVLEAWERAIRDERGLAPYGLASEARLAEHGPIHGANWATHTPPTLTGVVRFLHGQTQWACTEPTFNVGEYYRHLCLCLNALNRWAIDNQGQRWIVPCPTLTEDNECGNRLLVHRDDETTYCRQCARTWEVKRLIRVAGRDADVWVDIEAAAALANVTERTIRNWVKAKHVAKRGQLVRVLDIRNHVDTMTATA